MADSNVAITAGTGTNIDTRTEATNGHHRQVVVLGDPTTNDGVAPVDGTKGLSVDVKESVLPTGASTAANQSTIIGHVDGIETLLGTIDTDTGNIATEVAGLLTDTELRATPVPVSGSVTATQATGTNLHVVVDSAPTTAVTGTFYQATQPVSATDLDIRNLTNVDVVTAELSAVDNAVLDTIAAKDFATQTTLATINSKLVTGTDIGDVTINNSTGASAVNIQDGGNTITVDGTVAVTNIGTFAVQVDGSALTSLQLIDDVIYTDDTSTHTPAATKVAGIGLVADETSPDSVNEGDIGMPRMSLERFALITPRPTATGEGHDVVRNIDVDESEDDVKTSAGKIYGWYWYNDGAAEVYLKYYNATAANTTVGTTTPFLTVPIPAGGGSNIEFSHGIPFGTALCVAATTGAADNDTGAPATNQVVGFTLFK